MSADFARVPGWEGRGGQLSSCVTSHLMMGQTGSSFCDKQSDHVGRFVIFPQLMSSITHTHVIRLIWKEHGRTRVTCY